MAVDGIVRLSKIEVYPEYLDEYMKYATEGRSFPVYRTGGVDHVCCQRKKENPCLVTILETYASQKGLRVTYCIGTFSKVQTGNVAHG